MQYPKFEFHDSKNPFFTSPRYLPPTKMDNCQVNIIIVLFLVNIVIYEYSQLQETIFLYMWTL